MRSACAAAVAIARSPNAATVSAPPGGGSRRRRKVLPGTTGSPGGPRSRTRRAAADSSRAAAGRTRGRPCTPSTTRLLDVPRATPTGRPVTAAAAAAPRAMV
jgi:hypothetical protein